MGRVQSKRLALAGLAVTTCVACSDTNFSSGRDGDNDPNDAGIDADSGVSQNDASDAAPADGGGRDAEAEATAPREIHLEIANDADDATWIGGSDERLSYGDEHPFIEVGSDAELGRVGLRFALPIPRQSIIHSATLRARRVDGTAAATETMLIQVWDSAHLEPFDDAHAHLPRDHAPGGLWPVVVRGFLAGTNGSLLESPDLSELVQHVVDRPDWQQGNAIGFFLAPDTVQTWLGLADSVNGDRASLRIRYTQGG